MNRIYSVADADKVRRKLKQGWGLSVKPGCSNSNKKVQMGFTDVVILGSQKKEMNRRAIRISGEIILQAQEKAMKGIYFNLIRQYQGSL